MTRRRINFSSLRKKARANYSNRVEAKEGKKRGNEGVRAAATAATSKLVCGRAVGSFWPERIRFKTLIHSLARAGPCSTFRWTILPRLRFILIALQFYLVILLEVANIARPLRTSWNWELGLTTWPHAVWKLKQKVTIRAPLELNSLFD